MKKRQFFLFFLGLFFLTLDVLAAPSSNSPKKNDDPLGLKKEAFATYRPENKPQYETNIKKQIQALQSANQYSKKAFRAEKFSVLKNNAKKAAKFAEVIIPENVKLSKGNYEDLLSTDQNPHGLIENKILSVAQSVYIYNKLALQSKNWKESKEYVKQAMDISNELLYGDVNKLLENGDLIDYAKNLF